MNCNTSVFNTGKRQGHARRRKPGVGRQHGGIAPLSAMAVPALTAGGKAAALGGLGAAAKFGTHKALQALSKRKRKYKNKRTRTHR